MTHDSDSAQKNTITDQSTFTQNIKDAVNTFTWNFEMTKNMNDLKLKFVRITLGLKMENEFDVNCNYFHSSLAKILKKNKIGNIKI